jgi:hypothetical protein
LAAYEGTGVLREERLPGNRPFLRHAAWGRTALYAGRITESSIITTPMTRADQATAHAIFLPFSSARGGTQEIGRA